MRLYSTDRPDHEEVDIYHGSAIANAGRDDLCGPPERHAIRVLHIAETIAGGIASFFEEIASYQNEAFGRANVTFLIPAGSEVHLPSIDPAQIITFAPTSRRPGALLKFGRIARDTIRRLDPHIVHLHSSFAGAVVRASLHARTARPQVVYCPHGWAFGIESSIVRKLAYAAVERFFARRTDMILTNSVSEFDLAVRFAVPQRKLRVVKNGIAWSPRCDRRPAAGKVRLAFIGRHDRQKGVDVLLDTIERFALPNIHFDIVGARVLNPADSRAEPNRPNVTFHGWLSRAETIELLANVDGVVMPSRWDAAPIVALEAMRAGLPVIGSNRGALPEIIQHGVGGYIFDLDDADALGRLLERLDRSELRRLGASARARWESEYIADKMNELTLGAYQDLLSNVGQLTPPASSRCGISSSAELQPSQ